MGYTVDPNDPALGRGVDAAPGPQNEKYLVLSADEIAKGFVRPVRYAYRHVGLPPAAKEVLRDLTPEEMDRYAEFGYVKFETYPPERAPVTGRFWTQAQLDKQGCGAVTRMGAPLAETYARNPKFYGATYCVGCSMHLPVAEFVWEDDGAVVGS